MPLNSVLSPILGSFFGIFGNILPAFSLNSTRLEAPLNFHMPQKRIEHPPIAYKVPHARALEANFAPESCAIRFCLSLTRYRVLPFLQNDAFFKSTVHTHSMEKRPSHNNCFHSRRCFHTMRCFIQQICHLVNRKFSILWDFFHTMGFHTMSMYCTALFYGSQTPFKEQIFTKIN